MNISQIKNALITCYKAGVVPFIQGAPGVGKSALVKSIADEFKLELIDIRLSTCDPTDLNGFPFFAEGRASYIPFDVFPTENTPLPEGKRGWIIFLDEMNSASRAVQAASYRLILDREVGVHKLHPNACIFAAGNRTTDRAITNELSTAMQSRLVHLELDTDYNTWLNQVALPQKYDNRIIAFLGMYPQYLLDFAPDHQDKTFCCPRTWEFTNRLLKTGIELDENVELLSGTITKGVAYAFVEFSKIWTKLPSLEDIEKGNCNTPLESQAIRWAVLTSLSSKANEKNLENILKYLNDNLTKDLLVVFVQMLKQTQPTLLNHPALSSLLFEVANYVYQ